VTLIQRQANFILSSTPSSLSFLLRPTVVNLSSFPLSFSQKQALAAGFKFIPTKKYSYSDLSSLIRQALATSLNAARWRIFFRDNNSPAPKFRLPTGRQAEPCRDAAFRSVETFYTQLQERMLAKLSLQRSSNNFPFYRAFRSLLKHPSLKLVLADKNLGPVLLNYDHWLSLCMEHLSDHSTYRLIPSNAAEARSKLFFTRLRDFLKGAGYSEKSDVWKFVHNTKDLASRFYILAKIHKGLSNVKGRPIVACLSQFTVNASKFLTHILVPYMQALPFLLRSTNQLISELEHLPRIPSGYVFVTADVASLYPSIPLEEGIERVMRRVTAMHAQNPSRFSLPVGLGALLRLVLSNNIISFGDSYYLQVKGTAMGTSVAPPFANLFMDDVESSYVSSLLDNRTILYFRRFIDDIFVIVRESASSSFVTGYNSLHPNIKITSDTGKVANFLDVTITLLGDGRITLRPFSKPFNNHLYLPANSMHPRHSLLGYVRGELLRLARLSTRLADFHSATRKFWNFLIARNFREVDIAPIFRGVQHSSRLSILEPAPRVPQETSKPSLFITLPFCAELAALRSIPRAILASTARDEFAKFDITIAWKNAPKIGSMVSAASKRLARP
jgi:hypothetical protein